jgi:hypothetical protein
MKKVKESLATRGASEEEIKEFEQGAQKFAKKVVANFGDYEFLIGESMDPDGMYVEPPHTLSSCQQTDTIAGLSFSTTARTVSPLTSPCGSTVSRRRRCKQFIQREATRSGAEGAESVGKSNHRALSHERYPRTSMSNTVDTTIGNNLGLCLSHFHPKVNLSHSSNPRCAVMLVSERVPPLHPCSMHNQANAMRRYALMQQLASIDSWLQ